MILINFTISYFSFSFQNFRPLQYRNTSGLNLVFTLSLSLLYLEVCSQSQFLFLSLLQKKQASALITNGNGKSPPSMVPTCAKESF